MKEAKELIDNQLDHPKEFLNLIAYTEMLRRGMTDKQIILRHNIPYSKLHRFKKEHELMGKKGVATVKKVENITERTEEFLDYESNVVKAVILDGETGKVSLVQLPHHGDINIEMRKGCARKVKFIEEYLL